MSLDMAWPSLCFRFVNNLRFRQLEYSDFLLRVRYDVPGSARKALANAIGEAIGAYPAYQAAPSFAYIIGDYTLDRQDILTGPHNAYLLGFLAQDGYQTK